MPTKKSQKRSPIQSDETVKKATGKIWKQWVALIDKQGGAKMTHKEIARMLIEERFLESSWWAQSVTVGYEYAKGRRKLGETKDAGFEIGVSKIISVNPEKAWKFMVSPRGRAVWLGGEVKRLSLKKGYRYTTAEGVEGEIRTLKEGRQLRLTWKPAAWKNTTTVQLTLMSSEKTPQKTSVHFHQEKLASAKQRVEMKKRWEGVVTRIAEELTKK